MNNNIIDNIFDLKNKNIVTPYNLIENLKNDDYKYVNYSKEGNSILCNVGFFDNGDLIKFVYKFNKDFKLENILYDTNNGETIELFNRQKELEVALFKYSQMKEINNVI